MTDHISVEMSRARDNELSDVFHTWRPPAPEQVRDVVALQPVTVDSQNELRPLSFDDVVGQAEVKDLLRRVVDSAKARGAALDHMLIFGPAGTGKTTLALVVARELGVPMYQVAAPVSLDTLLALREIPDRSIVFVDELHLQAQGDRRGRDATLQAEQFFQPMEDRVIITPEGPQPFPHVTFIGATTDVGALPEAFKRRFMLQPRLGHYTTEDLHTIAEHNAKSLGLKLASGAAEIFARAGRGTPFLINRYMRNAASLTLDDAVDDTLAREVVHKLNRTTADGLDDAMVGMLTFLYQKCRHQSQKGEVRYSASVNTLATALGFSRDAKGISLHVEPELLRRGLVQVGSRGRELTPQGIDRARNVLKEVSQDG